MPPETVLSLSLFILGLIVGGLIGYAIASHFAQQASDELLRIARAFGELAEDHELVEWKHDKKGRISSGRIIRMKAEPGSLDLTGYAATPIIAPPRRQG